MKRTVSPFALLACCLALACACVCACACSAPDLSRLGTKDVKTIGAFLASDEFDALDAGVGDGSHVPEQLFFVVANGYMDNIDDSELAVQVWNQLTGIEIDAGDPTDHHIDDGQISFTFIWPDGTHYALDFSTSDYFDPGDGQLYPVLDVEVVRKAIESLVEWRDQHVDVGTDETTTAKGQLISLDGDTFVWDGNGDGEPETYAAYLYDNGDEAPNVLQVVCLSHDFGEVWIDGAYSIDELRAYAGNDVGLVLEISYRYGDFYSHEELRQARLHVMDGMLVME